MSVSPEANATDWRTSGPFRLDVKADFQPLHEALLRNGLAQQNISELLHLGNRGSLDLQLALRRTQAPTPINLLVRLFLLNRPVRRDQLEPVLAPMPVEPLLESGLLVADGDQIQAVPVILPNRDKMILFDPGFELLGRSTSADWVGGVSRTTLVIASMTPKSPAKSFLDIGTGQGFQALQAASYHQQVVATDVNPRALNFAAMSAKLNGLTHIDFRLGSMFEPVMGMTFDRIVCNPPFVISPSSDLVFRDSGRGSDHISREIIAGIPDRLNPGGTAVVIFDWHHERDDDWMQRPLSWVSGKQCDTWLLRCESKDPILYASGWLKELEEPMPERYGQMLDQWLRYYEHEGIKRISGGVMVIRKRTRGKPWVQTHQMSSWPQMIDCSAQVERIFQGYDVLEQVGGELGLLHLVLQLVPEHLLELSQQVQSEQWHTQAATLRLTQGLPFSSRIDGLVASILQLCDGKRTLGEALQRFAQQLNVPVEKVIPSATQVMRQLLETGLIEVVPSEIKPQS